jgi:hypothetical protein
MRLGPPDACQARPDTQRPRPAQRSGPPATAPGPLRPDRGHRPHRPALAHHQPVPSRPGRHHHRDASSRSGAGLSIPEVTAGPCVQAMPATATSYRPHVGVHLILTTGGRCCCFAARTPDSRTAHGHCREGASAKARPSRRQPLVKPLEETEGLEVWLGVPHRGAADHLGPPHGGKPARGVSRADLQGVIGTNGTLNHANEAFERDRWSRRTGWGPRWLRHRQSRTLYVCGRLL